MNPDFVFHTQDIAESTTCCEVVGLWGGGGGGEGGGGWLFVRKDHEVNHVLLYTWVELHSFVNSS